MFNSSKNVFLMLLVTFILLNQVMFLLLVFFLLLPSFVALLVSSYRVFISSVVSLLAVLVATPCSFFWFLCTLISACAQEVLL